jgi:spore coat polysaccharide biosynthesis protein SpsF
MDVEVFTTATLSRVAEMVDDADAREHVTRRLHHPPFHSDVIDLAPPAGDVRITVDDAADLERVQAIFEDLYPRDPEFALQDVLLWIVEHDN